MNRPVADTAAWLATARAEAPKHEAADAGLAAIGSAFFTDRARFFDTVLTEWAVAGHRQVVVLGAGYDQRAFRLDLPDDLLLIEVDLPEVLAEKGRRIGDALPRCRRSTVAADVVADGLDALDDTRLDFARPILWIAEGLLYYLTPDEVRTLLHQVGARSTQGSILALDHVATAGTRLPEVRRWLRFMADRGSPWRSAVADPAAWLRPHGWILTDRSTGVGRPEDDDDVVTWLLEAHRQAEEERSR
ncbi:methyltransferase (TIGR00027 family) [Actinoalloteichus hoggarensis]|uniref:S-adenosyl-L-methionine-dependent methyltransferase n=1 Tax=Actinoalloteichus hoggarensis TaxID=1470176 RepID=A0A221W4B2_9PSEU|nr:SAM-dependent methyltransferase [Actinoalloteichus hoggarensis]ASO20678.1 Putative S-adenosyl-L-methionine-dependent methyltransferase [Actinoalloteichus hoggarensis]MBB5924469.1 methyltransferase (TIGR00027 family) [Actinoalloteichus hoggarensis]